MMMSGCCGIGVTATTVSMGMAGMAMSMGGCGGRCSFHSARSRIATLESGHQRRFAGPSSCGSWATSTEHVDVLFQVWDMKIR